MTSSTTVSLVLESDEALALLNFLVREIDEKKCTRLKSIVNHEGELWALNGLFCTLEMQLPEQFSPDYFDLVSQALETLVERNGGSWPT